MIAVNPNLANKKHHHKKHGPHARNLSSNHQSNNNQHDNDNENESTLFNKMLSHISDVDNNNHENTEQTTEDLKSSKDTKTSSYFYKTVKNTLQTELHTVQQKFNKYDL